MMNRNILKIVIILVIGLFFLVNCEDFEDEIFEMGIVDETATKVFGDTLFNDVSSTALNRWIVKFDTTIVINDTLINVSDTVVVYDTSFTILDTLKFSLADGRDTTLYYDSTIVISDTLAAPTETVIYNNTLELEKEYPLKYFILNFGNGDKDTVSSEGNVEILDSLEAKDIVVFPNDTTYYEVTAFSGVDTSYLRFNSNISGEIVFYFAEYIEINIINKDGDTFIAESSDMPPELIAAYYEIVDDKPTPIIKSRYVYNLEKDKYLLQLITTEQTVNSTFHAVILYEQ